MYILSRKGATANLCKSGDRRDEWICCFTWVNNEALRTNQSRKYTAGAFSVFKKVGWASTVSNNNCSPKVCRIKVGEEYVLFHKLK